MAADGWARATVPGATVGAGYVTLRNSGTETRSLLRLTTPVCDSLSLHLSSVDANGVAHMWPLAKLELKPGEQVRFEPNGKHMMFSGLTSPLVAGNKVQVLLDGPSTYQAMFAAIQSATSHINMERVSAITGKRLARLNAAAERRSVRASRRVPHHSRIIVAISHAMMEM